MIGLLEGTIFKKYQKNLILKVSGVGYILDCSDKVLNTYNESDEAIVYVYTHVREDSLKLFGFIDEQEKNIFELLLSVSGIGPKNALNIISSISISSLKQAVLNGKPEVFKGISGIGTKGAQKIIIELKNKLDSIVYDEGDSSEIDTKTEVYSVLSSLGYSKYEIKAIDGELNYSGSINDIVKNALSILSKI